MNQNEPVSAWRAQEAAIRSGLAAAGVASREQLRERAGIDFLKAMLEGELPSAPIAALLDFLPVIIEPGLVVFQGSPGKQHYNPIGTVHGGYAATLLDSCVGCAVHSMLPAGRGYTTLELKINFVRPLTDQSGPIRAEGKVISVGNQVGIAEGRIVDEQGKLYAHATTTCLIFPI